MKREKKRKSRAARAFRYSPNKWFNTIFARMMALLMAVLLLQISIFLLFFLKGGLIAETEKNTFFSMSERVGNRALTLENEMTRRWTKMRESVSAIEKIIDGILEENDAAPEMLTTDTQLCQSVITASMESVLSMLRTNGVTGAFLILDCPDGTSDYPGLYLRDYDPDHFEPDNSDLLMERGLYDIAQKNGITVDSYWAEQFSFTSLASEESQFFVQPLNAAKEANADAFSAEIYHYWSEPFSLSELDRNVITYSVPLIYKDGTVLGVIGIDITMDWLRNYLTYDELAEEQAGCYYLGVSTDGGATYQKVCANGPMFQTIFGTGDHALTVAQTEYDDIVTLGESSGSGIGTIYGSVHPLALYGENSPFEDERWALIGIVDSDSLLNFSAHVRQLIMISAFVSLAMGIIFVYFAGRIFTRPITLLMKNLLSSGQEPSKPIVLPRTGLEELDTLAHAIELQSETGIKTASRTSKIIAMANIPIGVFEYNSGASHVFCSQSLFSILGWPDVQKEDTYLPRKEFFQRFQKMSEDLVDGQRFVYQIKSPTGGAPRWVQLFYREENGAWLGAFLDVTEEIEAVRHMEYERDFDMLTGIYNRRAFDQKMDDLYIPERRRELKIAALLMFDLDNLKFVNDSYGHEFGDEYLKCFAENLGFFSEWGAVIGRRSGDEFNVFLYGFSSQQELRQVVTDFWREQKTKFIKQPDGGDLNIRASGGMAWYPHDAITYQKLFRFADFAMYNSKNTVKGDLREFDQNEYAQKSIFIHGQESLNRLLDNHLVRYAFQPIVSAVSGEIYGYELLMRPEVEQLANLETLFRLAKSQSKLYQMERLTWSEAMAAFSEQVDQGNIPEHQMVFINSIASQVLNPEDFAEIEEKYGHLLPRVVMEITENDERNAHAIRIKRKTMQRLKGKIALDDFGSGYNHEAALVDLAPDFIKVDMSIIRGIDQNLNRQMLMEHFVRYGKQYNISVLAEGVETREEMEALIRMDVNLMQGYYLARPSFEVPTILPEVAAEIQAYYKKYH